MGENRKSSVERIGVLISDFVSDLAAHPFAQLAVASFCIAWFALGLPTDILSAAMAILAILLTQMGLNKQKEREADAHRRDVAMHAKLDELLIASGHARDELAGIEDLEEDQIEAITHRVQGKTVREQHG